MNWIIKLLEAASIIGGVIYFIDIQTNGKIDLPHRMLRVNKQSRLYKLYKKVENLLLKEVKPR